MGTTSLKVYIVLAGANYYPSGGADIRGVYDTEEKADKAADKLRSKGLDWVEVVVKGVQ